MHQYHGKIRNLGWWKNENIKLAGCDCEVLINPVDDIGPDEEMPEHEESMSDYLDVELGALAWDLDRHPGRLRMAFDEMHDSVRRKDDSRSRLSFMNCVLDRLRHGLEQISKRVQSESIEYGLCGIIPLVHYQHDQNRHSFYHGVSEP